jgi:hypothetical protein
MSCGFGQNARFGLRWPALLMLVLGLSGCKGWDAPNETTRQDNLSQQVRLARDSQSPDRDKKPAADDFWMSDKAKKTWHNLE